MAAVPRLVVSVLGTESGPPEEERGGGGAALQHQRAERSTSLGARQLHEFCHACVAAQCDAW